MQRQGEFGAEGKGGGEAGGALGMGAGQVGGTLRSDRAVEVQSGADGTVEERVPEGSFESLLLLRD